jgi:hypothetical protein
MSTLPLLDYGRLYTFSDPLATRPYRLGDREGSHLSWEQTRTLARGRMQIHKPIQFDAIRGRQATDMLWSQSVNLFCISTRLAVLLQENGITGWTTYPVELFDRKGGRLDDYYGLAVTGSECDFDPNRSKIVAKPPPVPQGRGYQVHKGLYFDESQWDGSDMFWVRNVDIVVTDRVFRLLKQHKIMNVRLTPLDEVEVRTSDIPLILRK